MKAQSLGEQSLNIRKNFQKLSSTFNFYNKIKFSLRVIDRRFEPHTFQLKIIPYIIFSASSPTLGANFTAEVSRWTQ